jgi:hypothetical protein
MILSSSGDSRKIPAVSTGLSVVLEAVIVYALIRLSLCTLVYLFLVNPRQVTGISNLYLHPQSEMRFLCMFHGVSSLRPFSGLPQDNQLRICLDVEGIRGMSILLLITTPELIMITRGTDLPRASRQDIHG